MSISLRTTGGTSMAEATASFTALLSSGVQRVLTGIFAQERGAPDEPRLLLRGVGIEEV